MFNQIQDRKIRKNLETDKNCMETLSTLFKNFNVQTI